jgi:hypothetical protein
LDLIADLEQKENSDLVVSAPAVAVLFIEIGKRPTQVMIRSVAETAFLWDW